MPVDPAIKALLDNPTFDQPPADWAHADDPIRTARMLHERKARHFTLPADRADVAGVSERTVTGPAGPVPVRIYRPQATGAVPVVLWLHGGGWMTGSLETGDIVARAVCADLQAVVVSVDYRLAPEHPWPAGLDDAAAVLKWVATTRDLDVDRHRVVVGGDSAGGNLAAALAVRSATGVGPALAAQLLLYPAVDLNPDPTRYVSRTENATGYGLTLEDVRTAYITYLGGADVGDWRVSPILATHRTHLAPAVIALAQYDPLRDEGRAYAEVLRAAAVPVVLHDGADLVHGCFDMIGTSCAAAEELNRVLTSVRELLQP